MLNAFGSGNSVRIKTQGVLKVYAEGDAVRHAGQCGAAFWPLRQRLKRGYPVYPYSGLTG